MSISLLAAGKGEGLRDRGTLAPPKRWYDSGLDTGGAAVVMLWRCDTEKWEETRRIGDMLIGVSVGGTVGLNLGEAGHEYES